ncbi:hypothetical protein [Xanthomonas oryzae]|uniref:hypothetical protein n=1 Tax=Xanthomonas oryzae TaxID=347 RepID=UPI00111005C4|nr:hypothetical protein [Xanthomonas oryzae]
MRGIADENHFGKRMCADFKRVACIRAAGEKFSASFAQNAGSKIICQYEFSVTRIDTFSERQTAPG